MKFLKRLFETRPLTLPELFSLNAKDGLYRGEILRELKNLVLFLGLGHAPAGPVNFDDPTLPVLAYSPDGRGLFLLSFVDLASLQQYCPTSHPCMIDFRSFAKIVERPGFYGFAVFCGKEQVIYLKSDIR